MTSVLKYEIRSLKNHYKRSNNLDDKKSYRKKRTNKIADFQNIESSTFAQFFWKYQLITKKKIWKERI